MTREKEPKRKQYRGLLASLFFILLCANGLYNAIGHKEHLKTGLYAFSLALFLTSGVAALVRLKKNKV